MNQTPTHTNTQFPILSVMSQRWSPYRFDPKGVEMVKLLTCLDAARWAASSYNEQPWAFIVAFREETEAFSQMLSCLLEANQGWASAAGVLLLATARKNFARNGNPNRVALHDLGQASAHLALQATALGLQVHQMAGINVSMIKQLYQVPDDYEVVTAIAMGYPSVESNDLNDPTAKRDQSPRQRKSFTEFVFRERFGNGINGMA
jgi:nitroreductase